MRIYRSVLGGGLALAACSAQAVPPGCELSEITGSRELHRVLSLRAVEVVKLAGNAQELPPEWIAPSAQFTLGAGDVGRPLGSGAAGARQLAQTMEADTYRFLGWDYMNTPADACSRTEVEVEFINNRTHHVSSVKFVFESGRILSANGWQRSFEAGQISTVSHD